MKMTYEEAFNLTVKRNAHKGKALAHKEWVVVQDGDDFKVALEDTAEAKMRDARDSAQRAYADAADIMRNGGTVGEFNEAMDRLFNAQMKGLQASLKDD